MNRRRALATSLAIWTASAAAIMTYVNVLRPLFLRWGATDEEAGRGLPGDELVPDSGPSTTNAITIDAPPSLVWPWLVQMGPGRAGAYTYDWVENLFGLNMHSADRIVPEWQHMDLGDAFPLGKNAPSLRVEAITPERELVLAYPDGTWSWAFVLEPLAGERTRLITRNRAPARTAQERLRLEVMLPGAFLMMRKMLLGIKERAERLAAEQRQLSPSETSGAPATQPPATPVTGQAA
jgi:hypothetical protein